MIEMNDFRNEPPELKSAMADAARRVIDSGWYVLGPEVTRFEKLWAQYCGVDHAVGVGNGMDAIEIGLRAISIGPGDEVITTAMTAFATVLAILRAGATPVLADIDPATGLLCPASVQRCITARTKAIMIVHLYGQIRNMDEWVSLTKHKHIALVEDCAQAHGAIWSERMAGSWGVLGAYSFYPTKNLGAPGDAGMLVTQEAALAQQAAQLRNYGQSVRYHHPVLGMNSRLDEMQAAMLTERLHWLNGFTQRRQAIASQYFDGLRSPHVRLMAQPLQEQSHVYHLFVLQTEQRDRLMAHLREQGVQTLIHYPVPVHHQEPCKHLAIDPMGLRNTEQHALSCLSLPCHPQMSDQDVNTVIDAVNRF